MPEKNRENVEHARKLYKIVWKYLTDDSLEKTPDELFRERATNDIFVKGYKRIASVNIANVYFENWLASKIKEKL